MLNVYTLHYNQLRIENDTSYTEILIKITYKNPNTFCLITTPLFVNFKHLFKKQRKKKLHLKIKN